MKRPLASALLVMALLALTVSSARAVPSIQAAIRLSPSFGPPTTLTKVQGSGFQAGETVDLTFDSDPVGQVVANARGRFATTVTMPASALPGAHLITATGESSGLQAQASFTVRTDWTKFHFDLPNTGENPFENVLSASTEA